MVSSTSKFQVCSHKNRTNDYFLFSNSFHYLFIHVQYGFFHFFLRAFNGWSIAIRVVHCRRPSRDCCETVLNENKLCRMKVCLNCRYWPFCFCSWFHHQSVNKVRSIAMSTDWLLCPFHSLQSCFVGALISFLIRCFKY